MNCGIIYNRRKNNTINGIIYNRRKNNTINGII